METKTNTNNKKITMIAGLVVVAALVVVWPLVSKMMGSKEANFPTKDITIVVPWNPGGATDLSVRALADEMGKNLGTNIGIVNTPGAGSSVGTQNVYNSAKDGYTLLGNGLVAFVSQPVMGLSDKTFKEWDIMIASFAPNVVAVNSKSPYNTMEDLVADMKAKPGQVTAGTAGQGSAGHIGAEILKSALGFDYKHVPYQGGNPAIIATLSGEVEFVPQLLIEMTDMLKAGEMKGLASLHTEDIQLEGGVTIPSILKMAPELEKSLPMGESTAILIPKGTPEAVVEKIEAAFMDAVQSETFKKFANEKGLIVTPMNRADAAKYVEKLEQTVTWTLYESGVAKKSPADFGIAKPQ